MFSKITVLSAGLVIYGFTFSQGHTSSHVGHESKSLIKKPKISNIQRYNIDYAVLNFDGDSSRLEEINLANLESQRLQNEDVQVLDPETGLTVILFFEKRARKVKHTVTEIH